MVAVAMEDSESFNLSCQITVSSGRQSSPAEAYRARRAHANRPRQCRWIVGLIAFWTVGAATTAVGRGMGFEIVPETLAYGALAAFVGWPLGWSIAAASWTLVEWR